MTTKKKKVEEPEALDPDDYVAKVYGDKYGFKTEKDLTETVDKALALMDDFTALEEENKKLKDQKPKFPSPAHESAYNFVSQFDPSMQGEALQTFAKLISMDIDNASPEMLLEEKFVHENPHWTRAEAQRMFKKDYAKKYTLVREKFEGSDAEFQQETEEMEIMKKGEIAKAKTYLKDLKSKHKPAEAEKPKVNEAVTKAVEKNVNEYGSFVKKTKEIVFEVAGEKIPYKFDDATHKKILEAANNWVSNPMSYSQKGELLGVDSPEGMLKAIVGGMFLDDVVKSIHGRMSNEVTGKRIEDLGKKQPKKRPGPGSGEAKTDKDNLDEQALHLIKVRQSKKAA